MMFDTTLWCKAEGIANSSSYVIDRDADLYYAHHPYTPSTISEAFTPEEAVSLAKESYKVVVYQELLREQREGQHPVSWEGD